MLMAVEDRVADVAEHAGGDETGSFGGVDTDAPGRTHGPLRSKGRPDPGQGDDDSGCLGAGVVECVERVESCETGEGCCDPCGEGEDEGELGPPLHGPGLGVQT